MLNNTIAHPLHVVEESPWPFISSISSFGVAVSLVFWFSYRNPIFLLKRVVFTIFVRIL